MNREVEGILDELRSCSDPEYLAKQAGFGIPTDHCMGVRVPMVRDIAKGYKKRHELADALWDTGYHEARLMVSMVVVPDQISEKQRDKWISEFYSWDMVDTFGMRPFALMPDSFDMPFRWAKLEGEYQRRTAFATVVGLVLRHKRRPDEDFLPYLDLCQEYSTDGRHYVKKAVGWALREMSKKRAGLHLPVQRMAQELASSEVASQRWIGKDVLREMEKRASR